jgi:hypothetical protein
VGKHILFITGTTTQKKFRRLQNLFSREIFAPMVLTKNEAFIGTTLQSSLTTNEAFIGMTLQSSLKINF